jgi:hypothetical protein
MDAFAQHQRGGKMPQVVEPNRRQQSCAGERALEIPLNVSGAEWGPRVSRENETVVGVSAPQLEPFPCYPSTLIPERFYGFAGQRDRPARLRRLGFSEDRHHVSGIEQRSSNGE